MDFRHALERVQESSVFKDFHKEHPSQYLTHCFIMLGDADEAWQIGYYDKDSDRLTTFFARDMIEKDDNEEIFHKPEDEHKVKPLNLDKVKLELGDALDKAKELQKSKHPNHIPMKRIAVLQTLDREVWNVTFLTATFSTLNIKIDAETGEVLSDEVVSLLDSGNILPGK